MTISTPTRHTGLAAGGGPRATNHGSVTAGQAAQPSRAEDNHETAASAPDPDEEAVAKSQAELAADQVVQNSGAPPQKAPAPSPRPATQSPRTGRRRGPNKTLARSELAYELRRSLGLTTKEAESALEAMEGAILTALERGESVRLSGIGTLTPLKLKERTLRNLRTGENFTVIPARVRFRTATSLKAAIVNNL